jgi:hypothetical protein
MSTPYSARGSACLREVLLITLLLAILPAFPRHAAGQDFLVETNAGTLTITAYSGPGGVVAIPGTINGLPVTAIGSIAFRGKTDLTGVVIPDSVTSVGNMSFYRCTALATVHLGNGVSTISGEAFSRCGSLTNIVIPDSVTYIHDRAFASCTNLTEVILGNGVSGINGEAFADCVHLASIKIPDRVTYLGWGVFKGCVNLTNAVIGNGLASVPVVTFENCFRLQNVTFGTNISGLADLAFFYCRSLRGLFFKGNAPSPDKIGSAFVNTDPAAPTAYYLPGTQGWEPSFYYYMPTVLWDPRPDTSPPNFGVGPSSFGFTITATTNIPVRVEASTELTGRSWTTLQTLTLSDGHAYFADPGSTNHGTRYYRLEFP